MSALSLRHWAWLVVMASALITSQALAQTPSTSVELPQLGIKVTLPKPAATDWVALEDADKNVSLLRMSAPTETIMMISRQNTTKTCAQFIAALKGQKSTASWLGGAWSKTVSVETNQGASQLTTCLDLPQGQLIVAGLVYAGALDDANFKSFVPGAFDVLSAALTSQAKPAASAPTGDISGRHDLTLSVMNKRVQFTSALQQWTATTRSPSQNVKEDVLTRTSPSSPLLEASFLTLPTNNKPCATLLSDMIKAGIANELGATPAELVPMWHAQSANKTAQGVGYRVFCMPLKGGRLMIGRMSVANKDPALYAEFTPILAAVAAAHKDDAAPTTSSTPSTPQAPTTSNVLDGFTSAEQSVSLSATLGKTVKFYAPPGQQWSASTQQVEGKATADAVVRTSPAQPKLQVLFLSAKRAGISCEQGFQSLSKGQGMIKAPFLPNGWYPEMFASKDESGISAVVCTQVRPGELLLGNIKIESQDESLLQEFKPLLSGVIEAISPSSPAPSSTAAASTSRPNVSAKTYDDDDWDQTYTSSSFAILGGQLLPEGAGDESLQGGLRLISTGASGGFFSSLSLTLGANKALALWYDATISLGYGFSLANVLSLRLSGLLGVDGFSETEGDPAQYAMPVKGLVGIMGGLTLSPIDFASISLSASPRWRYNSFRELKLAGALNLHRLGFSLGVFYNTFGQEAVQRGAFIGFSF